MEYLTGATARMFGVRPHHLLRAIRRGFVKPPRRDGYYRLFHSRDFEEIYAGLQAAGFRPKRPEVPA
jgi:DNA-binding transcriptional MerR regulator